MNKQTEVTFTFRKESDNKLPLIRQVIFESSATGFDSILEAEAWGYQEACRMSVTYETPMFLSNVTVDSENFVCIGVAPEMYAEVKRVRLRCVVKE